MGDIIMEENEADQERESRPLGRVRGGGLLGEDGLGAGREQERREEAEELPARGRCVGEDWGLRAVVAAAGVCSATAAVKALEREEARDREEGRGPPVSSFSSFSSCSSCPPSAGLPTEAAVSSSSCPCPCWAGAAGVGEKEEEETAAAAEASSKREAQSSRASWALMLWMFCVCVYDVWVRQRLGFVDLLKRSLQLQPAAAITYHQSGSRTRAP
jgi:hypothetical protein